VNWYRAYGFGFPTFAFPIHSMTFFLIFHGLVWSSILVIAGVMLAMRRRWMSKPLAKKLRSTSLMPAQANDAAELLP
jgi:hypothetical protein